MLLVLVAAGLAAYALIPLAMKQRSDLDTALEAYTEGVPASESDGESNAFAETAFIKRAVGLTARLADQRGFLERVETKLEKADLPLRPAEALFFYAASALVATVLALVLGGLVVGLVVLVLGVVLPRSVLNYLAARRRRRTLPTRGRSRPHPVAAAGPPRADGRCELCRSISAIPRRFRQPWANA